MCALGILFSSSGLYAVTPWAGVLTPSVTDDDVTLDGSTSPIVISGNGGGCNDTFIHAQGVDITVSVINANATVTGNANGPTILRLIADATRTINFDLTGLFSLTFEGSTDIALSPLLILCEGEGSISFTIRGGNSLTLTNAPSTNGPVQLYRLLLPFPGALNFIRDDLGNPTNEADQVFITIGAQSLLSYASTDGLMNTTSGSINFLPANVGDGRMVLQVGNTGAFTMAVHQAQDSENGICVVNRDVPAGGTATTTIINTNSPAADAALMINNYNATYAQYLIDPYGDLGAAADGIDYSGIFNGLRYGVSAGANHTLQIFDNAYLDYVGLANNSCPTPDSLPCIVDPNAPLDCPCGPGINQFLKLRNYSAFTIDGWYNPNAVPSVIVLGTQSGIYFRSGINAAGVYNDDFNFNPFTINPTVAGEPILMTSGAGEYVFDVEAPLTVLGSNAGFGPIATLNSRIEILSLEVIPHDGPLFPVEGNPLNTQFLGRTFATDVNEEFYVYNKAAWLINDRIEFIATALAHTDVNHLVCQNNDILSEPTYVGGEKWWLSQLRAASGDQACAFNYCITPPCPLVNRPEMAFIDSILQVQTSIAFTGVDLWVPTYITTGTTVASNTSEFRFYSNGYLVDNGTGRSMILGTLIGSQACDGCTIISDDAHLNVIQDKDFSPDSLNALQDLFLTASFNNNAVNNDIVDPAEGASVEVIYLGHNSNISIGLQDPLATGFTNFTFSGLHIAGDFFNFSTRGGSVGIPSTSNVTGQGGIFVDYFGTFDILPDFIASINAMVTKAVNSPDPVNIPNGIVNLPPSQVFFSDQIGIADWQQDLAMNPEIIASDEELSDYTLNWLTVTKNPEFFPYLIENINICNCPEVTDTNLLDIPIIRGEVNQLQIVNSRIGDPVHLRIAGGWVREILWLSDCRAGEAPTAVIAMQEHGRLGLNNAHRNPDSVLTQTVLGANGINIVANGDGRIDLNTDVIVNNICSILQGPEWEEGNVLEFLADTPYTLHVTKEGILDLSNFTIPGTIRFGGNIRVNFEPGARIILGAADLEFSDDAVVEIESAYEMELRVAFLDASFGAINNNVNPLVSVPYTNPNNIYSPLTGYLFTNNLSGNELQNTDPYRVRLMGIGTMRLTDNASMLINTNGILSVESLREVLPTNPITICEIGTTDVTVELFEAAHLNIGNGNNILGGVFQVGDVQDLEDHIVNFTLTINGADAVFNIGAGGFFGLGAGVVRPHQGMGDTQTNVLADTLFNANQLQLNLFGGELSHNRIFSSDDERSASMVIGAAATISVDFDNETDITDFNTSNYLTSGGGNFFLLVPGTGGEAPSFGAMRLYDPTNADDNIINAPFGLGTVPLVRMRDGILGSTLLISEITDLALPPLAMFLALKTGDATNAPGPSRGKADAAPLNPDRFRQELTFGVLGYVDRDRIGRQQFQDVIDAEGGTPGERRTRLYDLGAAAVQVNTAVSAPGPVTRVMQIIT